MSLVKDKVANNLGIVASTAPLKSGLPVNRRVASEEVSSLKEQEVSVLPDWEKVKDNIYRREVGKRQYEFKYRVKQYDGIGQMVDTWKKLNDNRQPFKSAREAEAHRRAFIDEIMARTERSVNIPNLHTLQEIFDDYKDKRGMMLAPNTLNKHISDMSVHIVPYFKKKHIESITVGDVKNFIIGLRKNKSYQTVRAVYATMSKVWKYAYELGIISRDTYIEIFVDDVSKVRIPKYMDGSVSKQVLPETFSTEQREHYFELARKEGEDCYILLCLCYYGGLRLSEALGLFWEDIDFETSKITIKQQLIYDKRTHDIFISSTKSKGVRVFTMPPALSAILSKWKEEQADRIPHKEISNTACISVENRITHGVAKSKQFVLCSPSGTIMTHSQANHIRERIQKQTGEHFYYHALRHTLVTNLASQGAPIKNISNYIGHADTRTTEKYYLGIDEVGENKLNAVLAAL